MVIFQSPENFCFFLYVLLASVGMAVIAYLAICDLILWIIKVVEVNKYEKLYRTNADFRDYVDRYMRNKDVTLAEVLSLKLTREIAEMYTKEGEEHEQYYYSNSDSGNSS